MAPENIEGSAYLTALKRLESEAPATVPELESSSEAEQQAAHGTLPGPERRRSPRYQCEGSVELSEEGCDVRTWAAFTDISLHGCYVEAQATYPVGTALRIKLEAKGIAFRTKGTVRVNYPYLGMGIAFAEMLTDERDQLRLLVASIRRPSVIIGPGIASSLPACEPLKSVPLITDPEAAIRALLEFFENRQALAREEFMRILCTSQVSKTSAVS